MCTIVVHAILLKYANSYYAMVENEFPYCLDTLTQRLIWVEAQSREHKRQIGDLVNRVLNKNNQGGSGKKLFMNNEHETIPRKQKKQSDWRRIYQRNKYGSGYWKQCSSHSVEGETFRLVRETFFLFF